MNNKFREGELVFANDAFIIGWIRRTWANDETTCDPKTIHPIHPILDVYNDTYYGYTEDELHPIKELLMRFPWSLTIDYIKLTEEDYGKKRN